MKKIFIIGLIAGIIFSSCKKNEFKGTDSNIPSIPVTVSNLYGTFNGVPTVSTSMAGGGAITITLTIPSNSGRTIKEITRVGLSTTPSNYKVVETSTGNYNSGTISGSGTSATFTTSLAEYTAKTGIAVSTSGTATSFLTRYFMFLITLDDGSQIFPVGVRVYVSS